MACASPYKKLQRAEGDMGCLQQFKPSFPSALYRTQVDITGKHISGLLLIKTLQDSSVRMVFSNEMGLKFFDFSFTWDSGFKVNYIMNQMNKKALVNTLRKDFELLLMQHLKTEKAYMLKDEQHNYYAFPQEKGVNYYVTDPACSQLMVMQRASGRKTVVEAVMQHYIHGSPDTIGISHKNFNFNIGLKKIGK